MLAALPISLWTTSLTLSQKPKVDRFAVAYGDASRYDVLKEHCEKLHGAGATISVSETLEACLKLGVTAPTVSGIFDETVTTLLDDFREYIMKG